jgi:hypothetical protein
MTREIKWRIIALQAMAVLIVGFAAGFLYYESSFANNFVRDQLVAQQIYFPAADQAVPGGSLDPAVYPDLQQYAGQQVDNGDKAKAYADGFIGRHLQHVYNGLTYSQVSSLASANPTDPKLTAAKTTLFQGESLRSMLLSAWGWSQVALYAFYASIALMVATAVIAAALIFELVTAFRRQPVIVTKPVTA